MQHIAMENQNILIFSAGLVEIKAKKCIKRDRFYVVLKTEILLRYFYGIWAIMPA